MATTTTDAFIAEMVTSLAAVSPTRNLNGKHKEFAVAKDQVEFREWAEKNPGTCTRHFTIYDLFEDEPTEVNDGVNYLATKLIEVLVAYQMDHKYGANRRRDIQKVIREDYRKINTAIGPWSTYTVGCTLAGEGEPFFVEELEGVSILTITYRARFYEAAQP